jgi:DNA-binding Lrp family transcriptional regulator
MALNVKENYQDILYQLELDSRRKFTKIGENAGLSQQTVSYAINTMKEDGVIQGFYPLFDYTKFGYNGYTVLFRVNTFSVEKLQELKEMFREHPMVGWVDRLAGGWDLMVFFLSPNASQFNKEFKSLIAEYPDQLWNYRILTSVVIHDMGRKYLNASENGERLEDFIIGGDRERVEVDESSRELCRLLWEDPMASSVEMAEKLDVTPKTVIDRMRKLEEKSLIKGYRPKLGIHELGVRTHLLFVKYNNRNVDQENALRDYCKEHPNITLLMKTFGDYDAVIRMETEERDDQREVINAIRERYEEILLDYDVLEVVNQVEKRYLPESYFEGEDFPED